jgi:hypothetical protein
MRPLTTSLTLLVAIPYLGACADSAEGGTPPVEGVVQGVSLEQPVVTDQPPVREPSPEEPTPGEGSPQTGDAAIQAMAKGILGVEVAGIDDLGSGGIEVEEGVRAIAWRDLSMEGDEVEDILDKMLYPDQYEADEYNLPERISELDGQEVAIVGYQIPLEWEGTTVPEFMLVGDLLGCCFGGAPMPDEWINVKMKGKGADYFPYIPVIVTGTLRVEGIEDEAGYAAGCYHVDATSVKKEL